MAAIGAKHGATPFEDRGSTDQGSGPARVSLRASSSESLSFPRPDQILQSDFLTRCPTIARLLRPNETIGEMYQRVTGRPLIITVDGLAAFGKGTIAKRLAEYYGVEDMSSGSAYRAVAYMAAQEIDSIRNHPWSNRRQEARLSRQAPISQSEVEEVIELTKEFFANNELRVVHGQSGTRIVVVHKGQERDITKTLLSQEYSAGASIIGEIPRVRELVLPFLRSIGEHGWVVDGRDMGTVVYPDAPVKFYFGEPEEDSYVTLFSRAHWRVNQRRDNGDATLAIDLEAESGLSSDVLAQMSDAEREELLIACLVSREGLAVLERDEADTTRKIAPTRCPHDAMRFSPIEPLPFSDQADRSDFVPWEERTEQNSKGEFIAVRPERLNGLQVLPEFEAFDRVRLMADARIERILTDFINTQPATVVAQ